MKFPLALIAFVMLASPSFAQDLTVEDEITMQQCIETVNDMREADSDEFVSIRECIGAAAKLCMDNPEGQTTRGMADCTMRENQWWDNYLNTLYAELKDRFHQERFDALREAQRAWITYRDAKCGFEYEYWKEGTIRSTFYTSCVLETTALRAIDLAGYVEWMSY